MAQPDADNYYQSLLLIKIDDRTASTSDQEQNKVPSCDAVGSTKVVRCYTCGENLVNGQKNHFRSKTHKAALKELKKEKKKERRRNVGKEKTLEPEVPRTGASSNEMKYFRSRKKLPEQNQLYINTLTAFFTLRYCLANYSKDFNVSINDENWKEFGDIVIEVINDDVTEVHAVQCRQIQTRINVTISALSVEEGDFSIKKLYETLKELRNKTNYETTYFKLFTVSNLLLEKDNNPKFTYDEKIVKEWKNDNEKKSWSDSKVLVPPYKENNLLNSTDDPDDICIFKLLNHKDEDLNDLNKFSLFKNQKKLFGLRELIKMMIEGKFDNSKDISNNIVKYIGEYFRTSQTVNENESYYKLTKTQLLMKVAELLLESNLVIPEGVIGKKIEKDNLKMWKKIVGIFDIIIIRNDSDIVKKLYAILNQILESKNGCTPNISTKLRVIKSEALGLWKTDRVPLILTAKNEKTLSLIIKVISFLKSENISLKFIIMTDLQISHSFFPEPLNVFFNLKNLKSKAPSICSKILKSISIDVLNFSVTLGEIVDCNDDYLEKLGPDALLNMFFKDYSIKDFYVPITDDIVDNILVFKDEAVNKISECIKKKNVEQNVKKLSYLVNIKGCPTLVQVPPDL